MRLYETTFVLNSQADDATLDNQVKAVNHLITQNGGKVVAEDRMGNRRLAYEIADTMQGNYTSILFEAPPTAILTLDKFYKFEEAYIRHLTILFEGNPELIRERQQAMILSIEASDRARRESRSHSRHGGSDSRRGRDSYSSRGDRSSSQHSSRPSESRSAETKKPSTSEAPKTETEKPSTSDTASSADKTSKIDTEL